MRQAGLRVFFLSERVRVENAHHANNFGKIVQAFIKLGFQETDRAAPTYIPGSPSRLLLKSTRMSGTPSLLRRTLPVLKCRGCGAVEPAGR